MGPPPRGPIATANHPNHEHAKRPGNDPPDHPQPRPARVPGGGGDPVRVKVWGARGSVPTPGPATNRYGGNTSCLQLTLSDGRLLVLDAGSGIRKLGLRLAGKARRIDILLTHLHLDHIQG